VNRAALKPSGGTIETSGVFDRDANSFGVLRLFFAGMVIVSHSWALGGFGAEPLSGEGTMTLGFVGVLCFFALSGLLVGLSAERLAAGRYLWHRSRRIFPAYWASLAVAALVFGPLIALIRGLPLDTLGGASGARGYFVNNITLHINQYGLGSVLKHLPYPGAINGSIWSLAYEFTCYLLIFLVIRLWMASGRDSRALLLAAGISIVLAVATWKAHGFVELQFPVLGPLDMNLFASLWSVFIIGTCLAVFRDKIPLNRTLTAIAIAAVVVSVPLGVFRPAGVLLLPYAVIGIGVYLPTGLHPIGTRNDISYGMYLYGFPVGQVLVAAGPSWWSPVTLALATLAATTVPATLSWFLVERPFLQRRRAVPPHGPGDAP
jgi:peptidoglycan/LPS O-acetylase OafA/YrhL